MGTHSPGRLHREGSFAAVTTICIDLKDWGDFLACLPFPSLLSLARRSLPLPLSPSLFLPLLSSSSSSSEISLAVAGGSALVSAHEAAPVHPTRSAVEKIRAITQREEEGEEMVVVVVIVGGGGAARLVLSPSHPGMVRSQLPISLPRKARCPWTAACRVPLCRRTAPGGLLASSSSLPPPLLLVLSPEPRHRCLHRCLRLLFPLSPLRSNWRDAAAGLPERCRGC